MTEHRSDGQLGQLLRDGMAAETRQLMAGPDFTERVIGRALAAGGGEPDWPEQRPPGWQNWILPAAAAVLVALLVGSVLVGTKLLHSSRPGPASQQSTSQPTPSPSGQSSRPTSSSSAPSNSGSPTTHAPGVVGPAGGPVPSAFNGYDLTWVSNENGWALGTASCGSPPCTSILRTTDGGKSWVGIPAPRAFLTATDTCTDACEQISNLRFANRLVGYAYGPNSFFMTTDGGGTWRKQAGGYAYGLEVVDGSVLRVSAQAAGCQPGCTFRLQRAAIGSDSWQDVSLPAGGRSARVELTAGGSTVVLATYANPAGGAEGATSVLFTSRDGGSSWQSVGEPCPRIGSDELDATQVAVAPDGSISLLCVTRGPNSAKYTMTSTDGAHFRMNAPVPEGIGSTLGALSATHLYMLFAGHGVYESTDGGHEWRIVHNGPRGGYYIGFESTTVGRVIGGAEQSSGPDGTWTTTDGGQRWTYHSFD